MKDKPKMYHGSINKDINNNLKVYNNFDKPNQENHLNKINDIRNKINMIINSHNFIYSKLVHIKIKDEIITRKIVGIRANNLVTIDNEYIPLDNISDIYI